MVMSQIPANRLVLVVTASYVGAVGFGEVFDCKIKRVLVGNIDEDHLRLCVVPADKDTLSFISAHVQPTEIEIGVVLHQRDEPYDLPLVSGFVDKFKNSWRIEYVREATGS